MAGKPPWPPRGEEGFSLVELLVAITLFGVVLTAVAGAFISSVRSVGDQRLRTAATRLASDRLETLRSVPFDQLEAQAGQRVQTIYGRQFTIDTSVATMVAANGDLPPAEPVRKELKRITAAVAWTAPGGASRNVSYTTAVAADPRAAVVQQAIGVITMFPSPATTDATGQPLEAIEVTVPLQGFSVGTLVQLEWTNADGTAGAKTLTSTSGVNWLGTVAKEQVRGVIGTDGRGEMAFKVSAGNLVALYTLVLQRVVAIPPTITGPTIDRNPVPVAKVASGRTCDAANQCHNTTNVVFAVNTTGLDAAQDSVVLQYQLFDGSYQEVALAPVSGVSGQWQITIRQSTTKFWAGTDRSFRFTAIRSADGATAAVTVRRDVVST